MALKDKFNTLKDILSGDRKKNKTIPVSHSKDHPDVQKIADKKLEKMKKKNIWWCRYAWR